MLFRLDELKSGKEVAKTVHFENEEIEIPSGTAKIVSAQSELTFRTDPMGYLVKHKTQAKVNLGCVRCGEDLLTEVASTDWLSLRIQQPDESHILLNNAEMNVRFISDLDFDLVPFVCELIEFELPSYPRHEDGDQSCASVLAASNEANASPSPFDALSKFLK